MSNELPVLRLGLAGFSAAAQESLAAGLERLASGAVCWELVPFGEADAWWVNGARTQQLADGTLRVASGIPGGRSIQLNLPDIDRPLAFTLPLPHGLQPACSFDALSPPSVAEAMSRFEGWLSPLVAQFCLAAQIVDNEQALGPGVYQVVSRNRLLAIVDLQGQVAVLPTASPLDFDDALWLPRPAGEMHPVPESFSRVSLSRLMWQYALRTSRDVLPARYRRSVLYFRRPPRLPQRLLGDEQLLLLRELTVAPGAFDELLRRTGLPPENLARDLGALYLVGAVTSNPKRAGEGVPASRRSEGYESVAGLPYSVVPEDSTTESPRRLRPGMPPSRAADLTAPAPMSLE